MQIVVKALNLEDGNETKWYRNIEGRLIEDHEFVLDFNENCAFNYHCEDNEGYIYLYSVNDSQADKVNEYKIFIRFIESEVKLAQEIVQKYLMYRSLFWESVNAAFSFDSIHQEDPVREAEFSFDFNKILNSPIQMPSQLINKEYSLPIIIPIDNKQTLELLAAGIHGLNNISIMTLDTIEEDVDYHKTVFITNKPDELKVELNAKLKEKKVKETLSFASKVLATCISAIGISVIVFTYIKTNFKLSKKK